MNFTIGDEFDLSPAGASRIISRILAVGGEFELHGNIVRITGLPTKNVEIKMEVVSPASAPEAPPVASPASAPEAPPVASAPEAEPAPTPAATPAPEVEAPVAKPEPQKATKASRKPAADEKK